MAGYPTRGRPILGSSGYLGSDGFRYTTLSYGNGRGYSDHWNATAAQRVALSSDLSQYENNNFRYPGSSTYFPIAIYSMLSYVANFSYSAC
jgi:hypothetical protein